MLGYDEVLDEAAPMQVTCSHPLVSRRKAAAERRAFAKDLNDRREEKQNNKNKYKHNTYTVKWDEVENGEGYKS